MGFQLTPEINAILISSLFGVFAAAAGTAVAWLRVKTRQLNDMAERTKEMAEANRDLLTENLEIAKKTQRQTDGINKKMVKIAEIVAFTKGRIKGREEGEEGGEYEELDSLEKHYENISDHDFAKKADEVIGELKK